MKNNTIKYILLIFVCLLFVKTDVIAFSSISPSDSNVEYSENQQYPEENNQQESEEDSENERPFEDDFIEAIPQLYKLESTNKHLCLVNSPNLIIAHISLPYPPPDCRA